MPSIKKFIALALLLTFVGGSFITEAYAEKSLTLKALTPASFSRHIKQKQRSGERFVIMLYASWCPYCQKKFPDVIRLEEEKEGSIIAISIDKNPEKLRRYLKGFANIPFPALTVKEGTRDRFEAMLLRDFGINFDGAIPDFALFDERGKLYKQGNYKMNYISDFIHHRD